MAETGAFTGLASAYGEYRPQYPAAVTERLREAVERRFAPGDAGPRLVVDVGAGTGISTRLLRRAFPSDYEVAGVEPNADMRRQAIASDAEGIRYVEGTAEALPFPDGSAVLVLVAQAVHWFDRPAFFAEAARVPAGGGFLALLRNDREWQRSPFLDAYEAFLEAHSPGYSRFYRDFDVAGELAATGRFGTTTLTETEWVREMTADEFIGMALSSTRMDAVVRTRGEEWTTDQVRALAAHHHPDGTIAVPYRTTLYLTPTLPEKTHGA